MLVPAHAAGSDNIEEQYPTIRPAALPQDRAAQGFFADVEKKKLLTDFSLSLSGGYDSNIHLDHYDDVGSLFAQQAGSADAAYVLSDYLRLRGSYYITSIRYFRESEPDLLNSTLGAGFDVALNDRLVSSFEYSADMIDFPSDSANDYTTHTLSAALTREHSESLSDELRYTYSFSHYPRWKTFNAGGIVRVGDRQDSCHSVDYRIDYGVTPRLLVRGEASFDYNNSNDLYLDYYDYYAAGGTGTGVYFFSERLYALVSGGYELSRYENRTLTDRDQEQKDHLLTGGASLFYEITDAVTLNARYDYRRNMSNEGALSYMNHIVSGGVFYRF